MTKRGQFGKFGGQYVSELLMPVLEEMEFGFEKYRNHAKFKKELIHLLKTYCGRPTPLYHAKRLSEKLGFKVYLKREDLVHGGAHKTNNTLAQALLAKTMGKKKLIAETGAGQHGVAVAMVGALMGMETKIFMGEVDIERQSQNVLRMEMCGAEVIPVESGSRTLKDAINEALRYWVSHSQDTFYVFGSVAGPHPYPTMVAEFQSVIGEEARYQILAYEKKLPKAVIACVGGGSNAMGIFKEFVKDPKVKLFGVEAAGKGVNTKEHSATITKGSVGILHGSESYVLQDEYGQIQEAHSVAPGLDYPGVGPEHSFLYQKGRVKYGTITDKQASKAFFELSKLEGIIPAIESSHAVAFLKKLPLKLRKRDVVIVNLSGRGDKDLLEMQKHFKSK